jgi:nitrite reductase/ring-hydroxylating ferredoxin subunit
VCTHGQAYLSEGWVTDDCQIECPLHAGCFDIRSGKAMGPPIEEDLRTYPVRIEAETIFVALPD